MITVEGKNHIRRYLAGYVASIGQSIVLGIGNRAESGADTALHLEALRVPVTVVNIDFGTNKLIFKGTVPDDWAGKIYEAGIYSLASDTVEAGSRMISSFDSGTEEWMNTVTGTETPATSVNTRIGVDSLNHTPGASASMTSSLTDVSLDLDEYSGSDSFTFAFNVGNANTTQVVFRFLTDASNYYSFNMGAQTSGYKIVERTLGSATVTGAPNWGSITEIHVITTSGAGGASNVEFDAIRLEDKDTINLDHVLVARKVLASPQTKVSGQAQDIEFALDVIL